MNTSTPGSSEGNRRRRVERSHGLKPGFQWMTVCGRLVEKWGNLSMVKPGERPTCRLCVAWARP